MRAVIVVQKMEEKAHEAKLQNGYFGTGNNNLNLHPFILDSSQGIKNDKYTDRNKMLFKPINHFEMFSEKKNSHHHLCTDRNSQQESSASLTGQD